MLSKWRGGGGGGMTVNVENMEKGEG